MSVKDLVVIHRPKAEGVKGISYVHEAVMTMETCLRYMYVGFLRPNAECLTKNDELLVGMEAYSFLLEVACGLRSAMPAEPEVFGQLKKQWLDFQETQPDAANALRPIMQVLFKDTKRVRKDFLQGISGSTYYSATDKLINLKRDDKLLIIGAGQFGQMLAQSFSKRTKSLYVMNRTEAVFEAWEEKWKDNVEYLPYLEDMDNVLSKMDHVLVAVPVNKCDRLDTAIKSAWSNREKVSGHLVHFCEHITPNCDWNTLPNFVGLNQVMAKAKYHSLRQSEQLEQAYVEVRSRADRLQQRIAAKHEKPRDNNAYL